MICTPVRSTATMAKAFTLIEVMIGVVIIGIGASLVMPRLLRRSPALEWPAIQQELTSLLYFAKQEAIVSQTVHRLTFAQKKRSIVVEKEMPADAEQRDKEGKIKKVFVPATSPYFETTYTLPESISFLYLKKEKKDLFDDNKGMGWCYVMPSGLLQPLTLCLERAAEQGEKAQKKIYETAPFLGTFVDREDQE